MKNFKVGIRVKGVGRHEDKGEGTVVGCTGTYVKVQFENWPFLKDYRWSMLPEELEVLVNSPKGQPKKVMNPDEVLQAIRDYLEDSDMELISIQVVTPDKNIMEG